MAPRHSRSRPRNHASPFTFNSIILGVVADSSVPSHSTSSALISRRRTDWECRSHGKPWRGILSQDKGAREDGYRSMNDSAVFRTRRRETMQYRRVRVAVRVSMMSFCRERPSPRVGDIAEGHFRHRRRCQGSSTCAAAGTCCHWNLRREPLPLEPQLSPTWSLVPGPYTHT
jgi:hypothetical protein